MQKKGFSMAGVLAALLTFGLIMGSCAAPTSGGGTQYTVSFDGGTGSGSPPASQTVDEGAAITLPGQGQLTAPSGERFNGWRSGGQTYQPGDSYRVNANTLFVAQWTPTGSGGTTYTVTYDANGGQGTAASQTAAAGASVTLAGGGGLSSTGKTFNGWNTDASGTGTAYNGGDSFTVNGNVTLYAQWTSGSGGGTTYTITYDANGGQGTVSSQTAAAGASVTLASGGGLSSTGKTFNGWNTDASGTGTAYNGGDSFTVNGNVTLYAQWTSGSGGGTTYTITYDANGGQGTVSSQTAAAGASVTLAGGGGLSSTGKTFSGWNTDASGTGTAYNGGDSFTVNGNVTLYAQWTSSGSGDIAVSFSGLSANGSSSQTTTQLTLTFSPGITGLSAGDITLSGLSGVSKGTLSGSGTSYTLGISGFSSGGSLTVSVAKTGYTISTSKTVTVYYYSAPAVPGMVGGLSATKSGSTIVVSWNAVSGATQYEVLKTDPVSGDAVLLTATTSRTYTDQSPHPGVNTYGVRAKNSAGTGSAGIVRSASFPLAAPSIGTISYGTGNQNLNILINPVSPASHATSYQVFWSDSASSGYTILGSVLSTSVLSGKVNFNYNMPRGSGLLYFKVEAVYEPDSYTRVVSEKSDYKSYTIPN